MDYTPTLYILYKLIANRQGRKLGRDSVLRRGVSINISIGHMAAKLKVLKGHEPNSPANYWDTQKIFKTQNSSLVHLSASTPSTVLMGQVGFFNFSLKIFKAP
jgi:hypothetical protein